MDQLRIPNEIGAVVTAILAGFAALFFAAWVTSSDSNESEDLVLQSSASSSPQAKLSELESTNSNLSGKLAEERSRSAEIATQLESAKTTSDGLESSLAAITEEKVQIQGQNTALMTQIQALQKTAEEASLQLTQLKEEQRASLEANRAAQEAAAAAEKKQKELVDELAACREKSAALQIEMRSLRRKLDESLFGEQLKPAAEFPPLDLPFLVNNPLDLTAPVRPLFIRLREFTGESANLDQLYAKLKEEGIHSARHPVPFGAGSDQASDEEKQKISEMLKSASPRSQFLVVGYASTDGSEKDNYELSSRRASNVAQWIGSQRENSENAAQAVYFGQTNRFSASEMAPNRVVEIWEIR